MRVFGALPDDRQLHRLMALAMEKNGLLAEAHQRWQLFEKEVATPTRPGPESTPVRAGALIWAHIGKLALPTLASR